MCALLMCAVSCNNEDEPRRTVFTVNTPMINHMVNTLNGEVLGISNTHNKLTIDTVKHTATLELNYNDGSDKTLVLNDLIAISNGLFYELKSPSYAQFSGYVDFSESSMRYSYTTSDGIRIVSTIADVFFRKTHNVVSYLDTTKATTMESTIYQFNIDPNSQTAIVKVMDIVHAKDVKRFINITANSVPFTVTSNGYTIEANNLPTVATYIAFRDTTGSQEKTKRTDKYPFKTFNATIDLVQDRLDATYMIGDSACVVATGSTYPDYTAY